jgi:hypothetical protein
MKEKLPFHQISQFFCRIAGAGNCCIPVVETNICKFWLGVGRRMSIRKKQL